MRFHVHFSVVFRSFLSILMNSCRIWIKVGEEFGESLSFDQILLHYHCFILDVAEFLRLLVIKVGRELRLKRDTFKFYIDFNL